ncbi:putative defense protein 3 [Ptychodera flava]|uniref:putative defense protein 3 n=1 Tax=Ptychodera flava TaxID=63121 RepID=UPI00396A356C
MCVWASVILAVAFSPLCVLAYGSGAPTSVCTSLTPDHKLDGTPLSAQCAENAKYSIMPSSDEYEPGKTMTVTVEGGDYQGIFLQARIVGKDDPVGTWSSPPDNTQLRTCTKASDSVTHANTNVKGNNSVYSWTIEEGSEAIEFVATIAENHDVYWVKVKSAQICGCPMGTSPDIILVVMAAVLSIPGAVVELCFHLNSCSRLNDKKN